LEVKWWTLRLLITGASGLFGSRLAEAALKRGFLVYSGSRKDVPVFGAPVFFDVSDEVQVRAAFEKVRPDVVVHSASLTDVDKCELNRELAWKTNVAGTEYVAEAAGRNRAFLVYVSTDYVFNGQKGCYSEDDKPDPVNYYGVTKLEAERVVEDRLETYCIARASVIYGSTPAAGKINFALWLLNKLRAKERVKIITDQWISPTLNTSMADMTLEIVERRLTGIFMFLGLRA
jgi:dTDP-4-dehydrorhamnose reductase